MLESQKPSCPECDAPVDRRDFIRVVGGTTAALAATTVAAPQLLAQAQAQPARMPKPAEGLIQELYAGMTADQRRTLVKPWNDANRTAINPNRAQFGQTLQQHYTAPQRELIERILKAMSSGDQGWAQIERRESATRAWDGSSSMAGCGAHIYGTPGANSQYAFVFTGHHLTVRCDGNSAPDTAFGGPIYYGHTPDGHSRRNCFFYQTRAANSVFDCLTEAQRRNAVIAMGPRTNPGEGMGSVQFRREHPGIAAADLTADQRRLMETVLRELLSPFRREDADEVMQLIRTNGGLERLHFAFFKDQAANEHHWHFWRIEGPGFVWNYRCLPHVHTFVNIARAPRA